MKWQQINPSTIRVYSVEPDRLLDRITHAIIEKLGGHQIGEDQSVFVVPEYGFSRQFEILGKKLWLTRDSDVDDWSIVLIDGVGDSEFLNILKSLLEEISD